MNVYDFDKTIYDGNVTFDFFVLLLQKDIKLIKYPIKYFFAFLLYKYKRISREKVDELFYGFLKHVNDIDAEIEKFIPLVIKKIKDFYLTQQQFNDLIISASPYFLVNAVCNAIGIQNVIGSEINKNTGKYIENNVYCFGKEKVAYFQKYFQNEVIEKFYSDSQSDEPLARLSQEAYVVKKNKIKNWF